jgi:DNA (cytosine-5)-methyltransferase 1
MAEYVKKNGLIMPYHYVRRPKYPTAFDFFSGAGGFALGMITAGFEVVGANEYDCAAAQTYMLNLGNYPMQIHFIEESDGVRFDKHLAQHYRIPNYKFGEAFTEEQIKSAFGDGLRTAANFAGGGWIKHTKYPPVRNFWLGDVRKLTGKHILDALGMRQGELDAVFGGPPCQGYSRTGKQDINDPRNPLVYEYARLIVELQPKTFVMEEVPDLINFFDPDGVPVIDKFCLMLQEGGYGKWEMLKKSLLMQTNAAAAIRSGGSVEKSGKRPRAKKPKQENAQIAMY